MTDHAPDTAPAALPFKPEFLRLETEIVEAYSGLLNDGLRSDLAKIASGWELLIVVPEKHSILAKSLRLLGREFRTIKGAARFIRAELTEKLIHEVEGAVANALRVPFPELAPEVGKLATVTLRVLDLVWEIRRTLEESRSESEFWSNPATGDRYVRVFREAVGLKVKLGSMLEIASPSNEPIVRV